MKKIVINFLLILTLVAMPFKLTTPVQALNGGDPSVGQIGLFPYSHTVMCWAQCAGQPVNIPSNMALYSLLGTTFGGDGTTTFNLPNLTSANPYPGLKYQMCTSGSYGLYGDGVIGEICLFPDSVMANLYYSEYWLKCDGSGYDTASYTALYGILSGRYGVNLPDLSDSSPLSGLSYYIACDGVPPDIYDAGGYELIGNISLFAFDTIPSGMVPCDGRFLQSDSEPALYSLLGTLYGGTGTTFRVPDLRGMAPLPGLTYCISTSGLYPSYS